MYAYGAVGGRPCELCSNHCNGLSDLIIVYVRFGSSGRGRVEDEVVEVTEGAAAACADCSWTPTVAEADAGRAGRFSLCEDSRESADRRS